MSDDARGIIPESLSRLLRGVAGVLGVLVVGLAAAAAWSYIRLPAVPAPPPLPPAPVPDWLATPEIDAAAWRALRSETAVGQAFVPSPGTPGARYRLAGIFVSLAGGAVEATAGIDIAAFRKAIIDDLLNKEQYLAAEGEMAGDARVVRIFTDRVLINVNGRDEELRLVFSGSPTASGTSNAVASASAEPAALEISKYGKRVGESRWILQRDQLMSYYREMLDNPERVAKLYETFAPDYRDGRVAGYRLDIKGEEEFLSGVGLKANDVLRQVNSMRMTSQSRAEFFLGEFVKERLSAVVLDIERDGKPQKLVYLMR